MRKKLLLADDSITIQKVVELTFPSDEFEVVTAGNGRIALDKAMAFLPDIVLCDVIMPQLDGYQVCEALRASEPLKDVPILLLNGAFEPYDAERAKSVGALGNVSKPFDPPALVARVKEILAERARAAATMLAPSPIPEEPMTIEEAGEALDAATVPLTEPAPESIEDYTYDDSETHPVSTVEVPMDVRALAARSLSLDAPVFAEPTPDVLTQNVPPPEVEAPEVVAHEVHTPEVITPEFFAPEAVSPEVITPEGTTPEEITNEEIEPADFSETLHGPLDGETAVEAEPIRQIEPIDELEPVAATGEIAAPTELAPGEPMEFHPDTASSMEIRLPPTLPPATVVAARTEPAPLPEEFGGEEEFEAAQLQAQASKPTAPVEAIEELPEAPAMAIPPPAAAAAFVAAAAVAADATAGAFDNLVGVAPTPEPEPAAAPVVPSAEVAVPVDMVQQIAQRVISQVSERVIREIAWDVIPGLAEKLIRAEIERIKARAESERD